jgi:hypothetical protein
MDSKKVATFAFLIPFFFVRIAYNVTGDYHIGPSEC